MKLSRSEWSTTTLFFLVWLAVSAVPSSAQSTDQVWAQLQNAFTTASKEGFKQYNYIIGYLDNDTSPVLNWPVSLGTGSSYLIVGVCDNDCTDVDLALEDVDRAVVASDTAADDLPLIRFTPSTDATYWIKPSMHECTAEPCGYGIGVFVK